MNLTECEIRSVLFMGLMVEWKSGTLHISSYYYNTDLYPLLSTLYLLYLHYPRFSYSVLEV
jgi:hypothetical protein